jgi:hypothetical protein
MNSCDLSEVRQELCRLREQPPDEWIGAEGQHHRRYKSIDPVKLRYLVHAQLFVLSSNMLSAQLVDKPTS